VIGISGNKGSGKGVVADYLVEKHGYTSFGFADTLKDICCTVFHLDRKDCEDPKAKLKTFKRGVRLSETEVLLISQEVLKLNGYKDLMCESSLARLILSHIGKDLREFNDHQIWLHSIRQILQYVGTEILRQSVDDLFHLRTTFNNISSAGVPLNKVVIHDARFPNERAFVKTLGGSIVRVVDVHQNKRLGIVKDEDDHKSENSLGSWEEYDYIIVNDKKLGIEKFHKILDLYEIYKLGI
jgi:hypothetical protein